MTVLVRYPSSNVVAVTGWTNPANAYSDNGVYATAAPGKNATISNYFSGFNFADTIGINDTINSVTIYFEYHLSTTASVATLKVSGYDGTTLIGQVLNHTAEPTTDLIRTNPIPATAAQLRSANFRTLVEAVRGSSTTAVTFYLDFVYVEVDYTPAATLPEIAGTLSQSLVCPVLSGAGDVTVDATTNNIFIGPVVSSSGGVRVNGMSSHSLGAYLVSSGNVGISGRLNRALVSSGIVSVGAVKVTGGANQSLPTLILSSIGTIISEQLQAITGYLSKTLSTISIQSSGSVSVRGNTEQSLVSSSLASAGSVSVKGRLNQVTSGLSLTAIGNIVSEIITQSVAGILRKANSFRGSRVFYAK